MASESHELEIERRINLALAAVEPSECLSLHAAHKQFNMPRKRLFRRAAGVPARFISRENFETEHRIGLALAAVESGECPNLYVAKKKFNFIPSLIKWVLRLSIRAGQ